MANGYPPCWAVRAFRLTGSLVVLISIPCMCVAQVVFALTGPQRHGAIVCIADSASAAASHAALVALASERDSLTLLSPPYPGTPAAVARVVNEHLNSPDVRFDAQRIYLLVVGEAGFAGYYSAYDDDVLAAVQRVATDTLPLAGRIASLRVPIGAAVDRLRAHYTWEIDLEAARRPIAEDRNPKRSTWSVAAHYARHWYREGEAAPGVGLSAVGFEVRRTFGRTPFSAVLQGQLGYRLPKPEDVVRGQAQSQFDFDALLAGEEISVDIATVLEPGGHGGLSLQGEYALSRGKLQPYLRAGFGTRALLSLEIPLDTTITLDVDGLLGGGGGASRENLGLGGGGDRRFSFRDLRDREGDVFNLEGTRELVSLGATGLVGAGLRLLLGKRLRLETAYQLEVDLGVPKVHGRVALSTWRVGLSYVFSRKPQWHYPYFRHTPGPALP